MNKGTPHEKKLSKSRLRKMRKRDEKKDLEARMSFERPEATDAVDALLKAPADSADWEAVIQEVLDTYKISQTEVDQREEILGIVEQTLKPHFPRIICRLFGSSDTRLGFKDSNTDVQLSLGYDIYNITIKKDGKEKAAKLALQIAEHFRTHAKLALYARHVGGRVPFVKLSHVPYKTRVDLSFGNVFAVANSSLVRLLCDSHAQVRPLLLLLRLWAISQNIAGRGRPKYYLTNYTIAWMALFSCMAGRRRLLPSLDDLRKQPYDSNMIEDWECGYGTDVAAYWQTQEEGPPAHVEGGVLALALEFFEYYADVDLQRWAVCPMVGKLVDRDILRRSACEAAEAAAVAVAAAVAAGPECDRSSGGEADDDDCIMSAVNGATQSKATGEGAGVTKSTEKWLTASSLINRPNNDALVTQNDPIETKTVVKEVYDYGITNQEERDYGMTDQDSYDYRIPDKSTSDSAISDVKGSVDITVNDTGATDSVITDGSIADAMDTENGVGGSINAAAPTAADTTSVLQGAAHATDAPDVVFRPDDDSYLHGLPEALIPHVPRIVKKYIKNAPLAVMDVFELNVNFTKEFNSRSVRMFQEKCRRSAQIIREVQRREVPLGALFTKIETNL